MKPFDVLSICPKCECKDVNTMYFEGATWISLYDKLRTYYGKQIFEEHLKRRCTRCRFSWPESTAQVKVDNSGRSENYIG
jgi:phage FluMu protein Com